MKWLKRILILILTLAGIVCLLFILATLAEFRPQSVERSESEGHSPDIRISDSVFSIVSWNIGYFGLGRKSDFFYDGGQMTRPAKDDYWDYSGRALEYQKSGDKSDFYFFQEVDMKSRRSYYDDQLGNLRGLFPGFESSFAINYYVSFVPVPLNNPMGKVKSGLLTFSSFHVIEHTRYTFHADYPWPVRLFMLDRCFLLSRLQLPNGKALVLINTHNEAFDDGSQRKQQLAVLKDIMVREYENGNYVITGGDWNQNPSGYSVGRFSSEDIGRNVEPQIEDDFFTEGWQWVFDPYLPTNRDVDQPYTRGKTPTTIIDFFVVSPNVEVLEVKTEDLGFEWSDHQPVRMKFKIGY